jgi:nucleotide-binding universal stress UspA family protein
MNMDDKSLLLAFTGADTSLPAVAYGGWLAEQTGMSVTLLGIVEKSSRRKRVEEIIRTTSANLETSGVPHRTLLKSGTSREVICQQALPSSHLTVFGSFDRPLLRRWLRGRSFRRIFQEIKTPVLYVRQFHPQLCNIVVFMGGLGHARTAEHWALFLAQRMDASITILHVVEPISYDYPIAREVQDHWQEILETDTPQGQNLKEALKIAQDMGVSASFQVRHGDIIHEILKEINSNQYDLIVMGSPFSSENLRSLFLPNITAEIAEKAHCPVLAASLSQELIFNHLSERDLADKP